MTAALPCFGRSPTGASSGIATDKRRALVDLRSIEVYGATSSHLRFAGIARSLEVTHVDLRSKRGTAAPRYV